MDQKFRSGIDWFVLLWVVGLHVGCIGVPYYVTWQGVVTFGVLSWLTGHVGVCLGYHRCLTHGSFETYRPVRWFLAGVGNLSGQGPALDWIATHRMHHQYSDEENDPHSPKDSFWWGHFLWFLPAKTRKEKDDLQKQYVPDLLKDPVLRFLDHAFLPSNILLGVGLGAAGYYYWDLHTAISMLVWGVCLRMVAVFHSTWLVNSATHRWGYRSYGIDDDSRNLWWVALLTGGEGWHNNHHAKPWAANHGHRWWEIDTTYWLIVGMRIVGLAKKVKRHEALSS